MTQYHETYELVGGSQVRHLGKTYRLYQGPKLCGERAVLTKDSSDYPEMLKCIPQPPEQLFLIGNPGAMKNCLSVIGARKATPYGLSCAERFARLAAEQGISIASGGAYGCDAQAHRAALAVGGKTVAFLGGGCDQIYPSSHYQLFQDIVDSGGAIVSEYPWQHPALPFTFRRRNRLIAGCAQAVLIVEAGLPSGTFSTADEALAASRDVLVIPGAITSPTSAGSNRLLYQGAIPVVDNESFEDILFSLYGILKSGNKEGLDDNNEAQKDLLLQALRAEPMRLERMIETVHVPKKYGDPAVWIRTHLVELEAKGEVSRYLDGRYGPAHI